MSKIINYFKIVIKMLRILKGVISEKGIITREGTERDRKVKLWKFS